MLPPETRLMPLCLRYLQIHCLDETPSPYQYPIDDNPALVSLPKSDPGTIPITLKISNDLVHDNFYSVKAVFDKSLGIVQRGVIKALAWSFEVRDGALELRIAKANTLTNAASGEQPLTPLEHNSRVRAALHKLRYKAMTRVAPGMQAVVVSEDTESDISENSALGDKELARLQTSPQVAKAPTPKAASPKLASPKLTSPKIATPKPRMSSPPAKTPAASLEPEGYFKRQLPESMTTELPVDIGRSAKGKERAEEFSRVRRQRSPVSGSQDLLSPYKIRKTPKSEPRPARLTADNASQEELTITKFPDYALEYLKYYYKI